MQLIEMVSGQFLVEIIKKQIVFIMKPVHKCIQSNMQVTLKQGCTCVLLQTVEQNWCVKRNMFTACNTALGNELKHSRNRVVCTCVYTLIQLLSLHATQSICGNNRHVILTWDTYNQLSNARKRITNTVKLKPMCENCRTQNN